jgi:hypothetical protein
MYHHKIIGTLVLVFAFVVFPVSSPRAANQAQEATVTGCLQAGVNTGDFVLVTDDKDKYEVQATEGIELAPHANQRVELTGMLEKTDARSVLRATALKMIASSCEP